MKDTDKIIWPKSRKIIHQSYANVNEIHTFENKDGNSVGHEKGRNVAICK